MVDATAVRAADTLARKHDALLHLLASVENLLVVQDLDGVCMGLVKDPLARAIDPDYVTATRAFDGHFYVLTNGEHVGQRGVNRIVERAFGDPNHVRDRALYLPGLGAGGVQWQDRRGKVLHPGVSAAELDFLQSVPSRFAATLREFFSLHPDAIATDQIESAIAASVLDNLASPTANLNTVYDLMGGNPQQYGQLQHALRDLCDRLLAEAESAGLSGSFFVHLAPNLGSEGDREVLSPARDGDSGTTDFQFMLRGAVKEAGVLALLNRYYGDRTGEYPLGSDFSVRTAPKSRPELLDLARDYFDPALMPLLVGVGDTVTSRPEMVDGNEVFRRGGSDRGFLQLIQDLSADAERDNLTIYIDSSGGEVKNRTPLRLDAEGTKVVAGPGHPRDLEEPLAIDVAFPGGHEQYVALFKQAARQRAARTSDA